MDAVVIDTVCVVLTGKNTVYIHVFNDVLVCEHRKPNWCLVNP